MQNQITLYKELTYIETYDGEIIPLAESFESVAWALNDENRFFIVWKEMIAKSSIKRAFTKQVDEVDNAILQIADKNLRMRVQAEVERRRREWYRMNMDVYKNILDRLSK